MLPSHPYKITASVSFSPDLLEAIDELCEKLNTNRSAFIREALQTYLKHVNNHLEKIEALAA
jgi:metal-responsive CopG/Arc/MetJ family transcriptional regulator